MKFHITSVSDKQITIMVRAEGEGSIGDMIREVHPGEKFFGLTFNELVLLGLGEHDFGFAANEE